MEGGSGSLVQESVMRVGETWLQRDSGWSRDVGKKCLALGEVRAMERTGLDGGLTEETERLSE